MPTIAVLGASSNRHKFGNKCVRAYAHAGYQVFPINPTEKEIEGFPAFAKRLPAAAGHVRLPGRNRSCQSRRGLVQSRRLRHQGSRKSSPLGNSHPARLQHRRHWAFARDVRRVG